MPISVKSALYCISAGDSSLFSSTAYFNLFVVMKVNTIKHLL